MADQPIPGPPAEAQLAALEAGLKLHERIKKLTEEVEALRLEHPTEPTWEDRRWFGLLIGFSLLGACVGFIGGVSVQSGISGSLLTGVMTFVTGALLSYGGFRWRRGTEAARIDPLRVGAGVGGFSAFVIVGICFGIAARDGKWLVPVGEAASPGVPGSVALASLASGAPVSVATAPKPIDGEGAMRGCTPEDLASKAAGWRQDVRNHGKVRGQCVEWFKPQLGLLAACAQAELEAMGDGLDQKAQARAYVDFGLSLEPGEQDLDKMKEALGP
jgi:hypothetical protein